ncbi:hypothetical protein [Pedobacter frigiditerrae]|uniref:hypothetical protein n=1 Tax=Pedobacter frigiditerrae TaxID=2530452 RepID=UPI00292DD4AB|nr:hypothetical protein [Pedobacter frigiditerrae]
MLLIINSCRKDKSQNLPLSKTELIAEAQSYFKDEIVNLPQLNDNNLRHSLDKTPLWDKASTRKVSIGEAVIVPIKYEQKIKIGYEDSKDEKELEKTSYLMLYKDKKQKMQAEWVTLLPTATSNGKKFVGTLIIEQWDGKFKRGYAIGDDEEVFSIEPSGEQIFKKIAYKRREYCFTINHYGYISVGGYNGPQQLLGSESFCSGTANNGETEKTYGSSEGGGTGTEDYTYTIDCANVINGTAYWDYGCNTCMGGTTGITECLPPEYVCNCDCPEEDFEMLDASLNYEPKWGQLGNKQQIKNEVNKITSINGFNNLSLKNKLSNLQAHFFADRMYTRDFQNNLIDAPNSKFVDRYVYTLDRGWIDMHHFFYAAYLSESYSPLIAGIATSTAEEIQGNITSLNNSSFSYEDKPSNLAGIDFWQKYHNSLDNGSLDFQTAIVNYLTLLNAKEPTEAPNFEYIPHIIDGLAPKNKNYKGLTGEELRTLAKESYCKKTLQAKMNIWEAHKKFGYSAH